jgi:hypothetical protein
MEPPIAAARTMVTTMAAAIQTNHCSRFIQAFMASPYPVARIRRHARRSREVSSRRLGALRREGPNSRVRKSHHDMARHPVVRSQRMRWRQVISLHVRGVTTWADSCATSRSVLRFVSSATIRSWVVTMRSARSRSRS